MTEASIKTPPHSIEAEQAVLGALMLDNQAWEIVSGLLTEQDFYRRDHRRIYRGIAELAQREQPCDAVTLAEWLEHHGEAEAVGGLAYLGMLARDTPSAANVTSYAGIVRERSILRQLARVGTDIADRAYRPEGRSSAELLEAAERQVFEIGEQIAHGKRELIRIRDLLTQSVDRIHQLYEADSPFTGMATGFQDFDYKTSGLQSSDLVIVAGRPSMGKTAFAMNIAENVAISLGRAVAVFSMEMPGEQLAMRLMSSLGRIDQHKVRTGQLEDEDWPRLTSAVVMLSEAPLFIDDTPALSAGDVRSRARRLKREHGDLGLIVIDYLQLMQAPGVRENANRALEISEISRELKSLAKELQVPVLALSQLNRSLEQRPNKRPVMSDLRECVVGTTPVRLADGRECPIQDLVEQPCTVASYAAEGPRAAASPGSWACGVVPVERLRLSDGRELHATRDHRVLTARGWRRVRDLDSGDAVGVMVAGHLTWVEVTDRRPEAMTSVYDLAVPGPEAWISNGIVSHNSGAIEQDADVVIFIYRDEVYKEDSPDKGVAEIILAKQRNGPIGTVRLTFLGQYTRFENFSPEAAAPF
jgi:replicative DNA helicase